MKILVACELPEPALAELRSLAAELVYRPEARPAELPELLADTSVLVVADVRIGPALIQRTTALQMIVHAGAGPGDIALDVASELGIFVTHCPDTHAVAVAELTLGLLLALDRRIVDHTAALREGRWSRGEFGEARGLAGRTLGVLGYDAVGRLVAVRARALGLRVVAWSPGILRPAPDDQWVEFCNWPRELARLADLITVHAGAAEGDILVDADFLASLRPEALLVHAGQPGAVDEVALAAALQAGRLRAALDVFATEPAGDAGRFRSRLLELPGVIATPHVGPRTAQAREATAAEVVRIVSDFVVGGDVRNGLNVVERSPATWQLVLRVRDQVGVMAAILEAIRADGINAQEISSRVFTGAKAAWCTVALEERPSTEALESIRALPDVLHLELRAVV